MQGAQFNLTERRAAVNDAFGRVAKPTAMGWFSA